MKTKKFLMVNIVSIAVLILIHSWISTDNLLLTLTAGVGIGAIVYLLAALVITVVFYFVLILALKNDKHLLSKPLTDKSQSFAKRFSVPRLAALVILELVHNVIVQVVPNLPVPIGADALIIIVKIIGVLHLVIAYFIIVGKESYLFRVGKYAAAAAVIVVLAYGASAAAEIVCTQIIAEKLASSMSPDSTDIFAMLNVMNETAIYSNVMSVVGTVAEIASFGSVIAFHKLARERFLPSES